MLQSRRKEPWLGNKYIKKNLNIKKLWHYLLFTDSVHFFVIRSDPNGSNAKKVQTLRLLNSQNSRKYFCIFLRTMKYFVSWKIPLYSKEKLQTRLVQVVSNSPITSRNVLLFIWDSIGWKSYLQNNILNIKRDKRQQRSIENSRKRNSTTYLIWKMYVHSCGKSESIK